MATGRVLTRSNAADWSKAQSTTQIGEWGGITMIENCGKYKRTAWHRKKASKAMKAAWSSKRRSKAMKLAWKKKRKAAYMKAYWARKKETPMVIPVNISKKPFADLTQDEKKAYWAKSLHRKLVKTVPVNPKLHKLMAVRDLMAIVSEVIESTIKDLAKR